ncbi:hypothetical protein FBZ93_116157 [Bradyrhizobium macuxiense]|uniref:Uncharacterized protein n=1 Tax=Bradyrhizobium macuxiense TaxID=1755647 RepID=A0A560L8E7_9BRAD|nr:hypothetical protein [Bradyrhizobium macuxiense]TWB89440.1 hypothetical protein FBZ93_116157 [Bradyrhizobium macuxiense]
MQFWIKCTRYGKAEPYYVNISLVSGMSREGDKTILKFVGGNTQTIEVNETPEQVLALHLGASAGHGV